MKELFSVRTMAAVFSLLLCVILFGHVFLPRFGQSQVGELVVSVALLIFVLFSISRLVYIRFAKRSNED